MRLYEKIISGKIRYPAYFTPEAKNLLKSLLTTDITKRFGNLANGSRDIFGHVWFQEVDWERLYRKEIPAPYVPKVEGDWDASNFDAYPGAFTFHASRPLYADLTFVVFLQRSTCPSTARPAPTLTATSSLSSDPTRANPRAYA